MRKQTLTVVWLALVAVALPAEAATVMRYANCAALNMDYPNGVGLPGAVDRTKGEPVTSFVVDRAIYSANSRKLDRDRDGIACEKL